MKNTIALFSILFFTGFALSVNAQDKCDDCPQPRIMIFDPYIDISPTEAYGLNVEPGFFKLGLEENDRTFNCMSYWDCHSVDDTTASGEKIIFSTIVTPPDGAVESLAFPDYIIVSRLFKTEDVRTISFELQTAISREVIKSASMPIGDTYRPAQNNDAAGYILAKNNFTPLFDIIRNFEKRKRAENSDVIIGTNDIDVIPEKSEVEAGEVFKVNVTFSDCDKQPLAGRTIMLQGGTVCGSAVNPSTGGKFLQESVTTDREGKAQVFFQADENSNIAKLKVYFDGFDATGDAIGAMGSADVKIKQKPTEKFIGTVTATVHKSTKDNSDDPFADKENSETTETVTCKMDFNSCLGCIERIRDPEQRTNILQTGIQYGILSGKTARTESGEPESISYIGHSTVYSTRYSDNNQLQLFSESNYEAVTNGYDWFISILIFDRKVSGGSAVYLSTQYWVKSEMVGNIRMYSDSLKYRTNGKISGKECNSTGKMQDVSKKFDARTNLGIPGGPDAADESSESGRIMLPLYVENTRELEEYLLNPQGSFTLQLKGRRYSSEDNRESDYEVKISIEFSPDYH